MPENDSIISNQFLDHAQTAAISAPKVLEQYMLQTGRAVLGIFTVPAFLILRRDFGTQAIHGITYCLAWLAFQVASLMSFVAEGPGLINIWGLYLAFIALSLIHAARLRKLILDMDRENDGEDEGTPWGFFKLLPFSTQPVIRCLYEPLALLVIPFLLYQVGILTLPAGIFFAVVSFALFVRTVLRYYELWTYMRDLRNSAYRAHMMQLMFNGQLSADQAQSVIYTAGPANLPKAKPADVPALDPEFAKLKTA